jgi:hypothetical protein
MIVFPLYFASMIGNHPPRFWTTPPVVFPSFRCPRWINLTQIGGVDDAGAVPNGKSTTTGESLLGIVGNSFLLMGEFRKQMQVIL